MIARKVYQYAVISITGPPRSFNVIAGVAVARSRGDQDV